MVRVPPGSGPLQPQVYQLLDAAFDQPAADAPPRSRPARAVQPSRVLGKVRRGRHQRLGRHALGHCRERRPDPLLEPRFAPAPQRRPRCLPVLCRRRGLVSPDCVGRLAQPAHPVIDVEHPPGLRQDLFGQVPDPFGPVAEHRHVRRVRHRQSVGLDLDRVGKRLAPLDRGQHRPRRRPRQVPRVPVHHTRRLTHRRLDEDHQLDVPTAVGGRHLAGVNGHLGRPVGLLEPVQIPTVPAPRSGPLGRSMGPLADELVVEVPAGQLGQQRLGLRKGLVHPS